MSYGYSDCASALLSHPGMDPNIKNRKGLTATSVQPCADGKAIYSGHPGASKSTVSKVSLGASEYLDLTESLMAVVWCPYIRPIMYVELTGYLYIEI